jgi:meiosis arrest female protein 1
LLYNFCYTTSVIQLFLTDFFHFRVADYGYTKLKDLFEALPHVVQIIGDGSRAMITLSHRAQVKRFTSDLLRVLKAQPAKQIALYDLPAVFEKSMSRTFKICDYGVCEIEDILTEVSETSIGMISIAILIRPWKDHFKSD